MERPARITSRPGAVASPLAGRGRSRRPLAAVYERLELGGQTVITGGQLPLRERGALQRLLEGTQGLGAPGARESVGESGRGVLASGIPSRRQRLRVAFSRQARLAEREARHAGQVADDV
jgi:hypothetical protein